MSANFTPGPWAMHPIHAQVDAMPSKVPVCKLLWPTNKRSEDETEANARLIAAAPDLYEALRDVVDVFEIAVTEAERRDGHEHERDREAITDWRAVLAKVAAA